MSVTHRVMPPNATEAGIARLAAEQLASLVQSTRAAKPDETITVEFQGRQLSAPVKLPVDVATILVTVLENMALGRGLTIIPEGVELTTVQAADVLNVSRPYLIKLLDEDAIPHRKVGKHRRILMEDLMAYKSRIDREREAVLEELTREAQEQGHGY